MVQFGHVTNGESTNGGTSVPDTSGPPSGIGECCVLVNMFELNLYIAPLHEMVNLPPSTWIWPLNELQEGWREEVSQKKKWRISGFVRKIAEKKCVYICPSCGEEGTGDEPYIEDSFTTTPTLECRGVEFPITEIECKNYTWPPSNTPRDRSKPYNRKTNPYAPTDPNTPRWGFSFDCATTAYHTVPGSGEDGGIPDIDSEIVKARRMCVYGMDIQICDPSSCGPPEGATSTAQERCKCPEVMDAEHIEFEVELPWWEPLGNVGDLVTGAFGAVGDVVGGVLGISCRDRFLKAFAEHPDMKGILGKRINCACEEEGEDRSLGDHNATDDINWPRAFGTFTGNPDVREGLDFIDDVTDPEDSDPNSDYNTSDDEVCGC